MQRVLVAIIILLAAVLLARDARVERADQVFLAWLLRNSNASVKTPLPLVIVQINSLPADSSSAPDAFRANAGAVSPLELALFLQALLDFKPTVLAIEPVLRWRDRDRDQEQVFLDQAMRVPKLLLGAELTETPDPDSAPPEIAGFVHITGRRGDLPTFTGIARQPDEDLRLISTLGFTNLPEEMVSEVRVPLLFAYRGEVIPSFALQTFLTWARIPMNDVQVALGSHIALPGGRTIPIDAEGALLINPNAARMARHLSLNELLLMAQSPDSPLTKVPSELVVAETPAAIRPDEARETRSARSAGVIASAIATLQSGHFVRRVSLLVDCVVLLLIAALSWPALHANRVDVILGAIAFSAAYILVALELVSRYGFYLPGIVPLSAAWLVAIFALLWPREKHRAGPADLAVPPPVP